MKEYKHFEEKLQTELKTLEAELATVGRRNPGNPNDWEAVPEKRDVLRADGGDVAENIEAFEENAAILKQLEIRYNEVKRALLRIKDGTFGICTIGKKKIEPARLEANPAAETCTRHMNAA